jgi:hypothetical protein
MSLNFNQTIPSLKFTPVTTVNARLDLLLDEFRDITTARQIFDGR